jgi:hypothetical protein
MPQFGLPVAAGPSSSDLGRIAVGLLVVAALGFMFVRRRRLTAFRVWGTALAALGGGWIVQWGSAVVGQASSEDKQFWIAPTWAATGALAVGVILLIVGEETAKPTGRGLRTRLTWLVRLWTGIVGWFSSKPSAVAPAPRYVFEHVFDRNEGLFRFRLRKGGHLTLICEVFDPRIERWVRMRPHTGEIDGFGTAQIRHPDDFQDAHTGTPTPGRYGVQWLVKDLDQSAEVIGEHVIHGPDWFDHDGNEFRVTRQIEPMTPDHAETIHGKKFRRLTMLYGVVANNGETAEFSAHIDNVEGLKAIEPGEDISAGYGVDEVAWEHTAERKKEISADGSARLLLLSIARRPRPYRLWFWTAKSEKWAPAVDRQLKGLRLRPLGTEFTFDLHVLNEATGERVTHRGNVRVSDKGDVLDFDLAASA